MRDAAGRTFSCDIPVPALTDSLLSEGEVCLVCLYCCTATFAGQGPSLSSAHAGWSTQQIDT